MPVHIMGQPCNMDVIWRSPRTQPGNRVAGTSGRPGRSWARSAISVLSASRQDNRLREGGAIVGSDEGRDLCYTVHNHGHIAEGRTERSVRSTMNEFEAVVLLGSWRGAMLRPPQRERRYGVKLKGFRSRSPKLYEGTQSAAFYKSMA